MKSTAKTSVQRLSNGTYRVGSVRGRSAITGRFVAKTTEKPSRSAAEAPKKK